MTYGAHKLMVETSLVNLTRLGRIEGVALRLCGLLARPEGAVGLRSAFMSDLFHACVARRPIVLPNGPRTPLSGSCRLPALQKNLIHAAGIDSVAQMRATTLPALRVTVRELAVAVGGRDGARHAPGEFLSRMMPWSANSAGCRCCPRRLRIRSGSVMTASSPHWWRGRWRDAGYSGSAGARP